MDPMHRSRAPPQGAVADLTAVSGAASSFSRGPRRAVLLSYPDKRHREELHLSVMGDAARRGG